MSDLQAIVTFVVFGAVLLSIALDSLDLALAALLGVSTLIVVGVFTLQDILNVVRTFGGSLALLFGGMVVARTFGAHRPVRLHRQVYSYARPKAVANVFSLGCSCWSRRFAPFCLMRQRWSWWRRLSSGSPRR